MTNKQKCLGIFVLLVVVFLLVSCGTNRLNGDNNLEENSGLEGRWIHSGGKNYMNMTITSETVTSGRSTAPYIISDDNIIMTTTFGQTVIWAFSLDGNTLNVRIAGVWETFTRRR